VKSFREHRWFRRITAGSLLFGIIAVTAVAYAAWTASGSGQGYAKAGTAQLLTTVDVSATTPATLYPSGTGNVLLRINNPNPYPVQVTTVNGNGTITSDKGALCDASTGVTFTNPLAALYSETPLGIPLHPTQIYEMMVEFANFSILMWLLGHKKFDGQVIGAYLFLYGLARYFLEFLRGDPGRGSVFGGMMTGTQLIAILLVIAGGVLWMVRKQPEAKAAVAASSN